MTVVLLSLPAVIVSVGGSVASAQISTWTATEALPAATAPEGSDIFSEVLSDLVCPAAGSCEAIETGTDTGPGYSDRVDSSFIETLSGGTWASTELPLPSNAMANGQFIIGSGLACPAVGSCVVATGGYLDTSGDMQGLIETLSGGTLTPTEMPAPANANSNPFIILSDLVCPVLGSCVAIGTYDDTSGDSQILIETLSSGTWTATEAPLPAGANPAASVVPEAGLSDLVCPAAGSCVAYGGYLDTSGHEHQIFETLTSGIWTPTVVPAPANAMANQLVSVSNFACPAAGSCVATGSYTDTSGDAQILIETLSGGIWTATEAPLPSNAITIASSLVGPSVGDPACPAVGFCVAVGSYVDVDNDDQALIETLSGGVWTATESPVPADAYVPPAAFLSDVACAAVGSCVATGGYETSTGSPALIDTLSGGTWTTTEAPFPSNVGGNTDVALNAPVCPAAGSCVATGGYYDSSNDWQGLLETLSGGVWTDTEAPLPADAAAGSFSNGPNLSAPVCPTVGFCVATGTYFDTSGTQQGLIETYASNEPLAITTTSLSNGTVGQSYSATLAATGGTVPYTWSIASGNLPAGLTLDPTTGVINGTPTPAGTFDFMVQVTDSTSPTPETVTASLSILLSPSPLAITTTSLPGGTVGQSYLTPLAATGGTAPYTWSLVSGSLPLGLSLSPSGTILGTPTTAGTPPPVCQCAAFTLEVSSGAATAEQAFTISVADIPVYGVENVVNISSLRISSSTGSCSNCFSIQQNFMVQPDNLFVQNVIQVVENSKKNGGDTAEDCANVWLNGPEEVKQDCTSWYSISFPYTFSLDTYVEPGKLVFGWNVSPGHLVFNSTTNSTGPPHPLSSSDTIEYSTPSPTTTTAPNVEQYDPELLIVGGSLGSTTFSGGKGTVKTNFDFAASEAAANTMCAVTHDETHASETSAGLNWTPGKHGTASYKYWSKYLSPSTVEQGIAFFPIVAGCG